MVCQEDVEEGQTVIAIESCQHTFHDKCIMPWILQNGSCPTCRNKFWSFPTQALSRLIRILEHQILCDRKLLTWVICEGVLKKFPNATLYNTSKALCEQVLTGLIINNIRILPIDLSNRNSFKNMLHITRIFLLRVHTDRTKQIHRWEDTIGIRNSLREYALSHPDFSRIWE